MNRRARRQVPGFGKDNLLARPGRWSRFALLHGHQVADIGKNCFEVRHLQPPGLAQIDARLPWESRGGEAAPRKVPVSRYQKPNAAGSGDPGGAERRGANAGLGGREMLKSPRFWGVAYSSPACNAQSFFQKGIANMPAEVKRYIRRCCDFRRRSAVKIRGGSCKSTETGYRFHQRVIRFTKIGRMSAVQRVNSDSTDSSLIDVSNFYFIFLSHSPFPTGFVKEPQRC